MAKVRRQTVNLTGHPDLVVVLLGMQVKTLRGVRTVMSFGPEIQRAVQPGPDGLPFHQLFVFGLLPLHVGIRQYWRDFDALERWVRTEPHRTWWRSAARRQRDRLLARDHAAAAGTDIGGYLTQAPAMSVFVLHDGAVYQSYGTTWRGVEVLMGYYPILDRMPKGRDVGDGWQLWLRRHDEYGNR